MNLTVSPWSDDTNLMTITGKMDAMSMSAQGAAEEFQAAATQKNNTIADVSGLEFLASLGIRYFFQSAKTLKGKGGKLILVAPTDLVRETLVSAGTESFIFIVDTKEEAEALL